MSRDFDLTGETTCVIVDRLRRLADDLEKLDRGEVPTPAQLDAAPLLRHWVLDRRPSLCLRGTVYGHPTIEDGHQALTSEIFAIDPGRTWVRSLSRFYALGAPRLEGL
ncbi:hypothetical protein SAMN06295905_1604 [Devosia lucknowensis]|uniref:Uncharacterized protein n=1 Tax=Devosia lucknowensis TaxID=1096929 RepID=A0A1Y6F1E2_9HYPH|nr:DUF6634 family protein [Devosia lucknowensis]SMQ68617.1 hypothetical protein SAMN06295905_1604 [Devosia lucknowensis]